MEVASSLSHLRLYIMMIVMCRLASLQVNGEEGWKRRIGEKDHGSFRSGSIHDRLSKIKDNSESWQKKIGQENDAKQFTVEGKMASKLLRCSLISIYITFSFAHQCLSSVFIMIHYSMIIIPPSHNFINVAISMAL